MSSVDVIVPCYRYAHFLRECVESVLAETTHDVRILIIDDASPDDTAEVAAKLVSEDSRVTFVRHLTNKKHIATYNEGIDWVSSDYMLLLSADDYLLPGALNRAIGVLDSHPEVGFVYGKAIRSAESGIKKPLVDSTAENSTHSGVRIHSGMEFIQLIVARETVNFVPTPTAVVRTTLQKKLGGYLPELPHSGDMEMWLRFAAHAPVGEIDEYQAVYREHSENMHRAYNYTQRELPDLEQREAALHRFYTTCNSRIPDAQCVLRNLFKPLSFRAVSYASMAFNAEEMILCQQLSEFALRVYPQIRQSSQWRKLAFKKRIGTRLWHMLRPVLGASEKDKG